MIYLIITKVSINTQEKKPTGFVHSKQASCCHNAGLGKNKVHNC